MTPPWRGFVDSHPVALEISEVRDRWPAVSVTHWQVDRPGVQLASSADRARELDWPRVVELFTAARREDAPLAAMVRDAEAKSCAVPRGRNPMSAGPYLHGSIESKSS